MASFLETYTKYIKPGEGGYSNHADDAGKETYRGISRRYYPTWPGWKSIDEIKEVRIIKNNEVIAHIDPLAEQFYGDMWDRAGFNWIKNQKVADLIFDFYVNSGGTAIRMVQKLLNLKTDGVMGPLTISAINDAGEGFLDELWDARRYFYTKIVQRDPDQVVFFKGWMNRLEKFK